MVTAITKTTHKNSLSSGMYEDCPGWRRRPSQMKNAVSKPAPNEPRATNGHRTRQCSQRASRHPMHEKYAAPTQVSMSALNGTYIRIAHKVSRSSMLMARTD